MSNSCNDNMTLLRTEQHKVALYKHIEFTSTIHQRICSFTPIFIALLMPDVKILKPPDNTWIYVKLISMALSIVGLICLFILAHRHRVFHRLCMLLPTTITSQTWSYPESRSSSNRASRHGSHPASGPRSHHSPQYGVLRSSTPSKIRLPSRTGYRSSSRSVATCDLP